MAQNRPSTHFIEATSCVEGWHITIGEQALAYILFYQTLLEDQNWSRYYTNVQWSLSKGGRSRPSIAVNNLTPTSPFWWEWKTPAWKAFGYLNTSTQIFPPWWSRFPLQRRGFEVQKYCTPGSLSARGWTRPPSKGFSRINKIQEKLIYFYCLSVNCNNRWPAVGNDSQNGIHCRRQAPII